MLVSKQLLTLHLRACKCDPNSHRRRFHAKCYNIESEAWITALKSHMPDNSLEIKGGGARISFKLDICEEIGCVQAFLKTEPRDMGRADPLGLDQHVQKFPCSPCKFHG
ncbi:hypothetical protein VNO77_27316 [Canavalia gladiata]|uniref:Uncharacterized protein n=1 Tax=Canavalia gladiata TaxID=3824 RepID=A0AAN9KV50_CANGL